MVTPWVTLVLVPFMASCFKLNECCYWKSQKITPQCVCMCVWWWGCVALLRLVKHKTGNCIFNELQGFNSLYRRLQKTGQETEWLSWRQTDESS